MRETYTLAESLDRITFNYTAGRSRRYLWRTTPDKLVQLIFKSEVSRVVTFDTQKIKKNAYFNNTKHAQFFSGRLIYCQKPQGLLGKGGGGVWRWGQRETIYLSLHCHHQNDSFVKVGSVDSHF